MDQIKMGRFIAAMRKAQGMTQETLGEKLNVTNKTVSRWETGAYMPDIDKLQELSAVLGVSVNELLCGEMIADEKQFKKIADENLVSALSDDSMFGLQDRIRFFKRKWIKDHKWWLAICVVIWLASLLAAIFYPMLLGLVPCVVLLMFIVTNNRVMAYVEQNAFRK